MEIAVRPTEPGDLEAIFQIFTHPSVRPNQYPHVWLNSVERWQAALFGGLKFANGAFSSSTILNDALVVGHIMRMQRKGPEGDWCHCGWNLDPRYWGMGIMPIALSMEFENLFGTLKVNHIISDCFRDNHRCIRVLEKLNYEPVAIKFSDRLTTIIQTKCIRWILRYRLTQAKLKALAQ